MNDREELDEIRRRLSAFADSIPDHGLKGFGDLIEIVSVESESVYLVTLETEYEERILEKKEKPDDGSVAGITDHAQVGPNVNVWDTAWDSLVKEKQPGPFDYGLPGSTKATRCGQCAGHGAVQCERCKGVGEFTCSCRTGWTKCPTCSGKRKN